MLESILTLLSIYLSIYLSDETLNRGPDSLWSFKIPWLLLLLVKSGVVSGVVLAKFPPLALVNHGLLIIPIHLIGSIILSPLHL